MSLLENPTTYNLSEYKFSLGFAIFNAISDEFVDLNDFQGLLNTYTNFGNILFPKTIA